MGRSVRTKREPKATRKMRQLAEYEFGLEAEAFILSNGTTPFRLLSALSRLHMFYMVPKPPLRHSWPSVDELLPQ